MPPLKYRPKISYDGPGTVTPAVPALVAGTAGALPTATYFVRSSALFALGESAVSPEASVAVTGPTGSLTATVPVTAGALAYRHYISTAAGAQAGYIDTVTNGLSYTGQPLTPGYPSTKLVNVSLALPQRLWRPKSKAIVGGADTVPSGAGESYVIQWAELCTVILRYYEAGVLANSPVNEQEAIRRWWKWAVTSMGLTNFFFDQTVNVAFAVYVDTPTLTDGLEPEPDSTYPRARSASFLLRIGDNLTPITPPFYANG
jgi:hypothetical protein